MALASRLSGWLIAAACLSGCSEDAIVAELEAKFPIEVEGCVCRFLAFEADGYTGVKYAEMLEHCNVTIRNGHPSLSPTITSEPEIASLRCTEDVEDWTEEVEEALAQQASNRRNYAKPNDTEEPQTP